MEALSAQEGSHKNTVRLFQFHQLIEMKKFAQLIAAFSLGLQANADLVEEWRCELLADVTMLQNAADGTWDHGLEIGEVMWGKERVRMSDDLSDFLSKRKDLFVRRSEGLAIFLTRFALDENSRRIWRLLLAEARTQRKLSREFEVTVGPGKKDTESCSIERLFLHENNLPGKQ